MLKRCNWCEQDTPLEAHRTPTGKVLARCYSCHLIACSWDHQIRNLKKDRKIRPRNPAAGGKKLCTSCRIIKPTSEYFAKGNSTQAFCKPCSLVKHKVWSDANRHVLADSKRQRAYGLKRGEYDQMVAKQKGRCKICKEETAKMHVDHCHDTGKVRGLLCQRCNTGIGQLRHSPRILKAAAHYLRVVSQKSTVRPNGAFLRFPAAKLTQTV